MAWNMAGSEEGFHASLRNPFSGNHQGTDFSQILKVLQKLKIFRNEGRYCDVVVHVNNATYQAHRAVLAAWSPKLALEISGKNDTKVQLFVQCNGEDEFVRCLDFMYSGKVSLTSQNILSVLQLAQSLAVNPLVEVCEEFLAVSVDGGNLVEKYFIALKYNLSTLQERVLQFVQANITGIIETAELLGLSPQDFKLFITQGKMASLKQEMKFSLILRWVGINVQERDKYLLHLFNHVSWAASVTELLEQINCTQNIFTTNEFCLFQLLHSLVTSSGHQLGPFAASYPRLFSMYSHMLEDLVHPKVFSQPSHFALDTGFVSVSVKCDKDMQKVKPAMKETGVNTDICFESTEDFIEAPVVGDFGLKDVESESVPTEAQVESHIDALSSSTKHRRKSLPRKITIGPTDKIQKEKKPSKRQKKSIGKDSKDTKTSSASKRVKGLNEEISDVTVPTNVEEDKTLAKDGEKVAEKVCYEPIDDSVLESETEDHTLEDILKECENPSKAMDSDLANGIDADGETAPENIDKQSTSLVEMKDTQTSAQVNKKKGISVKKNMMRKRRGRPAGSKNKKQVKVVKEKVEKPKKNSMPETRLCKLHCSYENCAFTSKTEDCLEKHVERVHMIDVELTCHKCNFTTKEMKALCFHMKSHFTSPPYRCEIEGCSYSYLRIGLYIRHQMTHLNIKPYKCDLCGKHFALYNQLSCHKKLHEGRQFQCDVCLKKFTTKGALQQHHRIHFSNKPYLCDTCGFSTKHQSHLISHRKIHTGDVLRCSFPNCTYTTPKQGHMTQHMNSHLNIRNHICQVCGKSFVVRGKLLRHERIHMKDKLFKCKQCDYQTSRTDRMKLHIESHGIKFPKKKFNVPNVEESEKDDGIDFHQFYEKIQSSTESSRSESQTVATFSLSTSIPMDVISFAASTSMIVDNYSSTIRLPLDPLSAAAAEANIDELQTATNFQTFERIHTTAFDQL